MKIIISPVSSPAANKYSFYKVGLSAKHTAVTPVFNPI